MNLNNLEYDMRELRELNEQLSNTVMSKYIIKEECLNKRIDLKRRIIYHLMDLEIDTVGMKSILIDELRKQGIDK